MRAITISEGQTLFDIALQEYGTIMGVAKLMEHNPGELAFGVATVLTAGMVLQVESTIPQLDEKSKQYAQAYKTRSTRVNSGLKLISSIQNCYVEPGYVGQGYVSCPGTTTKLDLVNYYTQLLSELGILNDLIAGRNNKISATIPVGETIFSIIIDSDEAANYTHVTTFNVDSYIIRKNQLVQVLPVSFAAGDEYELEVVATDDSFETKVSLLGTY